MDGLRKGLGRTATGKGYYRLKLVSFQANSCYSICAFFFVGVLTYFQMFSTFTFAGRKSLALWLIMFGRVREGGRN